MNRRDPDAPALVAGERGLTHAELASAADTLARRLAARGVRPGDRVATSLPAGLDFAVLLHAAPRIGAVVVPLNTRLTAGERRAQVDAVAPALVVEAPLEGPEADVALRPEPDPQAPHTILFTSGTTARGRPVVLTWANHRASAVATAERLDVGAADRWLCCLPLFHVGGLAILLRGAVLGCSAEIHPGFDPERVLESLASGEVTLASFVSTMVRRLIRAGLETAPAVRAALVGGGPVPRDLLRWAGEHGLPLVQTYGLTETASQIATLGVGEALERRGSAGRPLAGVELHIGEREEILVRGPMVSGEAIGPDGWLHTGDAGRIDPEGFLWVEGRLADTIVTGGENVAAAEVEEALAAHPAVAEAAVVGRPDPEWGEAVTAYVVLERPVEPAELIAFARERVAGFKVPKAVIALPALPRNAGGKVLKRALPR